MKIEPNTTVTLPLSAAYELAPRLRGNVESMLRCGQSEVDGTLIPTACAFAKAGDANRELEGLLNPEQLDCPGALVVLPGAAEPHLDALLEKTFEPMTMYYDGLMRCTPVLSVSTESSSLSIELDALECLTEGHANFYLAIASGAHFRIRRICNQPPLDDDEMQVISFCATNYRPRRIYSDLELQEAAEQERANRDAPHWLARAVVRLN